MWEISLQWMTPKLSRRSLRCEPGVVSLCCHTSIFLLTRMKTHYLNTHLKKEARQVRQRGETIYFTVLEIGSCLLSGPSELSSLESKVALILPFLFFFCFTLEWISGNLWNNTTLKLIADLFLLVSSSLSFLSLFLSFPLPVSSPSTSPCLSFLSSLPFT